MYQKFIMKGSMQFYFIFLSVMYANSFDFDFHFFLEKVVIGTFFFIIFFWGEEMIVNLLFIYFEIDCTFKLNVLIS